MPAPPMGMICMPSRPASLTPSITPPDSPLPERVMKWGDAGQATGCGFLKAVGSDCKSLWSLSILPSSSPSRATTIASPTTRKTGPSKRTRNRWTVGSRTSCLRA
jgi:hypothetical protein